MSSSGVRWPLVLWHPPRSGTLGQPCRGGLCSWCVSPGWAEAAVCLPVWQRAEPCRAAVGCPEERSPAGCRVPAVLARRSHRQPLTVPDRTVDVRLCTERRARREGEGETSAQQRGCEFQINLLLCWCLTRGAPGPPAQCMPLTESRRDFHAEERG